MTSREDQEPTKGGMLGSLPRKRGSRIFFSTSSVGNETSQLAVDVRLQTGFRAQIVPEKASSTVGSLSMWVIGQDGQAWPRRDGGTGDRMALSIEAENREGHYVLESKKDEGNDLVGLLPSLPSQLLDPREGTLSSAFDVER
jgi:hypothetical protein